MAVIVCEHLWQPTFEVHLYSQIVDQFAFRSATTTDLDP